MKTGKTCRRIFMVVKGNTRKYLSEAELRKLLSYVNGRADLARRRGTSRAVVDELIILLLARAGLRTNEVCTLKIGDLPLNNGEHTLWIRNQAGKILRKVEINSDISELLARFVRFYRNGAEKTDYLLVSERGNPFGYMNIYSKVRKMADQSGIGKLSPVTLRHTFMIRLFETEKDLRYVQEQTGYDSLRTVAMHIARDKDQKEVSTKGRAGQIKKAQARHKRRDTEPAKICEACGKKTTAGSGKKIESGQFLCKKCLSYF
jgi:integrase